jgi:hypothetical protein
MALLSSVFGTALGSAAKVGSEAIQEARQRDALRAQEFKKNVQAKKAAFAKQQAAASKKASEIKGIANFLSVQPMYQGLNAIELNDLALQLNQMAGGKNAIDYFNKVIAEDKMTLIPRVKVAEVGGGMKDVGLVDGRPVAAQKEKVKEVRASSLVKPKEAPVLSQTSALLAPVKRKSFFAEALTGKDLGTVQRDALAEMGMTEEQYSNAMSSLPTFPSDNNTASFISIKSKPTDTLGLDRLVAKDETIRKIVTETYPEMLGSSMMVPDKLAPKDQTLRAIGGSVKPEPVETTYKNIFPFIEYDLAFQDFLTGTNKRTGVRYKDEKEAIEAMAAMQSQVFSKFGVNQRLQKIVKKYDEMSGDKLKNLVDLSNTLPMDVKSSMKYTENMKLLDELKIRRSALMFSTDANAQKEVIQLSEKITRTITDMSNNLGPFITMEDKRKKYKATSDIIQSLESKESLAKRMSTADFEKFINLRNRFNKALLLGDAEEVMNTIRADAVSLMGNLELAPRDQTDKVKEQSALIRTLYNDWEGNNSDASEEKKSLAKKYITNWVEADGFSNLKDKELDGAVFGRRVRVVDDGQGNFTNVVEYITLDMIVDNIALKSGYGPKELKGAEESIFTYTQALMNLGEVVQVAERDGLAFGTPADIRMFFGNTKEIARSISELTGVGTAFFGEMKNEAAYLKRINQIAINFVSSAKGQLFKDPRLSDQDLTLVLNFIGILGRPGEIKLIGQSNALAAIIGLERVFLAQLAKNMYIAGGKEQTNAIMAGDFYRHEETGASMIELGKPSMASKLFKALAKTRGIDLDNFTGDDGRLNDAKINAYFKDPENTFGYKGKKKLNLIEAKKYFAKTLNEMHASVDYALDSANAITQYKSSELFQKRHVSRGMPIEVTNNPRDIARTREILQNLADDGVPGAAQLLQEVDNGKRTLHGANWTRREVTNFGDY